MGGPHPPYHTLYKPPLMVFNQTIHKKRTRQINLFICYFNFCLFAHTRALNLNLNFYFNVLYFYCVF